MRYIAKFIAYLSLSFMFFLGGLQASFAADAEDIIKPAVISFQTIGELRRQNPIDAEAIAEEYAGVLQTLTQQVDTNSNLHLDSYILAAIDAIRNNNEPRLAVQIIDKTVQRVFFQIILKSITSVRDDFDTKSSEELNLIWDEATAAFEAIKGTAARENKILTADRQSIETGSNPALDTDIAAAFLRGQAALNKINLDEDRLTIGIERQVIRLSLVRAYVIGVLRELEGVISNRDREVDVALEKQKEGEIFYRIIEEFVSRDNPVGNILIKSQLTENISNVAADSAISEISKGFIGRVKGELNANESSVGNDRERAMIVAEEARLYTNIFLPDLELRLGTEVKNDLDATISDLKVASSTGDVSIADARRQTINDILENYENELELAEYNKTNDTAFIDSAVSAFQAIGTLRRQSPIDADAITEAYTGELQQLTQFVDQLFGLNLNNIILSAITDIKNDVNANLAAQVIDKTVQRVFAMTVLNRTTLVLNTLTTSPSEDLELEWDRAFASYLAIAGTAARDNKVLADDRLTITNGSNPHLDSQITMAFILGKQALKQENPVTTDVAIEREKIILSLVRSFFIGVLREVEGIQSNRDREIEKAQEKQKEGEFFYAIVEGLIANTNPNGNATIKNQLVGDVANVVADQIVSEISKGLIGQLNRNLDINALTVGIDQLQAKVSAEGVAIYTSVFIDDVGLRLGSLERVKLENALQALKISSDTNNTSNANQARQEITSIIADYMAQLLV